MLANLKMIDILNEIEALHRSIIMQIINEMKMHNCIINSLRPSDAYMRQ